MDRLKECQLYIKKWYLGEPVVSVRMDGGSVLDNLCIQAMVVELLRDLIDNPVPESFVESSTMFNTWMDDALKRVMGDMNFGFSVDQCSAVKNLAWNYWVEGIRKTQSDPALADRLFKCSRGELEQWTSRRTN
jgi:hypothetical protein